METPESCEPTAEEDEYYWALEREWRVSLPQLTEAQWLDVFPEAKSVLPSKVVEWQEEIGRLTNLVKNHLKRANTIGGVEGIAERIRAQLLVPKINEARAHIVRIKRLIAHSEGKKYNGRIMQANIEQARSVPIESLLPSKVQQGGNRISTRCVLHNDKSPSLVIYRGSNSFYCFGCNQGGDSIALIRLLHKLTFVEAVNYLNRL